MYDRYCDHDYVRDDANCEICVRGLRVATGELQEQLDRIEDAAKEATNAAQNAERAAEELQR